MLVLLLGFFAAFCGFGMISPWPPHYVGEYSHLFRLRAGEREIALQTKCLML